MDITDGPWIANIDHSGTGWRIETDAPGYPNDGWVIAELHGPDAAANAKAMAALPELVDVLRVIADLCRTVEASGNWFDDAGFTLMHHKTFAGSIKLEQLRRARDLLARMDGL